MLNQLPALVAVAGISLAIGTGVAEKTPNATTTQYTSELITTIINVETDVAFEWCAKEGRFGK